MFKVSVGLKEVGKFERFTEAFQTFFKEVRKQVSGGASLQVLETTNFIVCVSAGVWMQMGFYQARDFAYKIGLLVGRGELREIKEPPGAVIEEAFMQASANNLAALARGE